MEKLKTAKSLTQKKVRDFGATFSEQGRVTTKWLKELRSERNKIKQGNIQIVGEMVTQQSRNVLNWKVPVPDGVQDYWLIIFPALHERIAT